MSVCGYIVLSAAYVAKNQKVKFWLTKKIGKNSPEPGISRELSWASIYFNNSEYLSIGWMLNDRFYDSLQILKFNID